MKQYKIEKIGDICNIQDEKAARECFVLLMDEQKLVNGLQIVDIQPDYSGSGSKQAVIIISKDEWIGDKAIQDKNKKYLVGANTFFVHIESTYDSRHKKFSFALHYEINPEKKRPYISHDKYKNNSDKIRYEAYESKKQLIKEKIHRKIIELGHSEISFKNDRRVRQQLAIINIKELEKLECEEFIERLGENIEKLSELVDKVLYEIRQRG